MISKKRAKMVRLRSKPDHWSAAASLLCYWRAGGISSVADKYSPIGEYRCFRHPPGEPDRGDIGHADADMLMKWTLAAGVAAFAASASLTPAFGAKSSEAVFACTNLVSGAGWDIRINFDANTVDSNPARISRTEISWHDAMDGGNYTLDRRTGNLTVIFTSSTGGYFLHDHCAPRD